MNKNIIIVVSSIIFLGFILLNIIGCTVKQSPGEPVTLPSNTPTPNLTPVDVSAQLTKTCFSVDTCTMGSATSAITEDKDGYIWASEQTVCAYFVKYDAAGNSLFSIAAPRVEGMTADKTNNWIWYSYNFAGTTQSFVAKDSNNIIGTSKAGFSISKLINKDKLL